MNRTYCEFFISDNRGRNQTVSILINAPSCDCVTTAIMEPCGFSSGTVGFLCSNELYSANYENVNKFPVCLQFNNNIGLATCILPGLLLFYCLYMLYLFSTQGKLYGPQHERLKIFVSSSIVICLISLIIFSTIILLYRLNIQNSLILLMISSVLTACMIVLDLIWKLRKLNERILAFDVSKWTNDRRLEKDALCLSKFRVSEVHFISHKWHGDKPDNNKGDFRAFLSTYIKEVKPKAIWVDCLCVDIGLDGFEAISEAMCQIPNMVFTSFKPSSKAYRKSAWCTFECVMNGKADDSEIDLVCQNPSDYKLIADLIIKSYNDTSIIWKLNHYKGVNNVFTKVVMASEGVRQIAIVN
jgi:hypothetical protein